MMNELNLIEDSAGVDQVAFKWLYIYIYTGWSRPSLNFFVIEKHKFYSNTLFKKFDFTQLLKEKLFQFFSKKSYTFTQTN